MGAKVGCAVANDTLFGYRNEKSRTLETRFEGHESRDSGGKASLGYVVSWGIVLRAQRQASGECPARIWVGVVGKRPAWQHSALAYCSNVAPGMLEPLEILEHGARSGLTAEALQAKGHLVPKATTIVKCQRC